MDIGTTRLDRNREGERPKMPNAESSLLRGLSVLDAFRESDSELSLTQIAQRASLPKSTAHRLVSDLTAWGALERTGTGLRLGIRLFELGHLVPVHRELREIAMPFLEDLHQITQKTVNLAILDKNELLYVEKLVWRGIPAPDSRSGGRLPLHCTALGKAILAFSATSVSDEIIQRGLTSVTERSITSVAVFRRELAEVRHTRIAFDREETTLGLFCVATPFMDQGGQLVGAISVSGVESILGAKNIGPALLAVSRAISRELGT
jgi:DNA-binding IclR family transcriptional regulator